MVAIKGIYEGGIIKPVQPIPVSENFIVTITFIEPLKKSNEKIKTDKVLYEVYDSSKDEYLKISESSIDFWYNDVDDRIWNNV